MERIIAVAMSGGVDSSVTAWLLGQQGHARLGLTMRLLPGDQGRAGEEDARRVAGQLGISHHVLNLQEVFAREVLTPFAAAYEGGQTPNPCMGCNRRLKFGALLDHARALGCGALATGHYARLAYDGGSGRYLLKKATHPEKDQSYFLSLLTQEQLAAARFPLGEMAKEEIRALALQEGLASAMRRDSQDICFVPEGEYARFICDYTGKDYPAGEFRDEQGLCLGHSKGIIHYTVGQRRGLGISARQRLYVKELLPRENAVVLCPDEGLYHRGLMAGELNLIACDRLTSPIRAGVRIRSRHGEQPALVEQVAPERVRITFDKPQRAIAPGQAAVFYDGDTVIGGAIIESPQKP